MRYITMEIQNNADGSASFPSEFKVWDDINKAISEFHRVMMYASISTAPSKGCVILTSTGELIRSEFCEHPQEETEE